MMKEMPLATPVRSRELRFAQRPRLSGSLNTLAWVSGLRRLRTAGGVDARVRVRKIPASWRIPRLLIASLRTGAPNQPVHQHSAVCPVAQYSHSLLCELGGPLLDFFLPSLRIWPCSRCSRRSSYTNPSSLLASPLGSIHCTLYPITMTKPNRRLGHKKSRNGCLRCKARRVKVRLPLATSMRSSMKDTNDLR